MQRLWIARLMLALAAFLSLLLALALPAPRLATTAQSWTQLALLLLFLLSLLAAVLVSWRPAVGWPLCLAIGACGLVMLVLSAWPLLFARAVREGATAQALSASIPLTLWSALVVAGACGLGWARTRQ
jgi:hypothetical protein